MKRIQIYILALGLALPAMGNTAFAETLFDKMLSQNYLMPLVMANGISRYLKGECLRLFPSRKAEIEESFSKWPYLKYDIATSINGKVIRKDENFLAYVRGRIGSFEGTELYEERCVNSSGMLRDIEASLGIPKSYLDEIDALVQ